MINDTLVDVEKHIVRTVYSLWLILGIPGGILNLLIFSRPSMRKTSCCIYFFATSLNNLVSLGVGVVPVMYSLNNPDPLVTSVTFCKVRGYFLQISLMISRWFTTFASIDRFATSSSSSRLRAFAQVRIAYGCIAAIIVFWCSLASHRLVFYEIKGTLCAIASNPAAALFHTIYILLGGGVLPTTIMIICALLIRRNLAIRKKKKEQKVTIQFLIDQQKRNELMDSQVMVILYIQITCYIILMTPQMGNVTYNAIVTRMPDRSITIYAIDRFVAFIAELMMYVFPVLSFYLYTLSSGTFRGELWDIFGDIQAVFSQKNRRRIGPLRSSTQNDSLNRDQGSKANTSRNAKAPIGTMATIS